MGLACSAQQTRFRIIGRRMCDFVKKREKQQPRFPFSADTIPSIGEVRFCSTTFADT